jgi:hypothetical protein
MSLRPRRVAIIIRNDAHWRDWAMTALATASDYWGGAGYILVPFDLSTGVASAVFADVVRAYDPDHVVTLSIPATTWEEWYPGTVSVSGAKDEADRLKLIANSLHFDLDDEPANAAREQVASWCSPMRVDRLPGDHPKRGFEAVKTLRRRGANDRPRGGMLPAPVPAPGSRVAAAVDWRSDTGLFAALRLGVASSESYERSEPTPDALYWLIRREDEAPESLIWSNDTFPPISAAGLESWFLGEQRLMQVSRGYLVDRAALVVGDTAEDFALALAYDRVIGGGIWLTPALIDDQSTFRKIVQPAVRMMLNELERSASQMAVTSTSATADYLADVAKRIQGAMYEINLSIDGHPIQDRTDHGTVAVRTPNIERGLLAYVADEHIGASVSLPVSNLPDGAMEALVALETPVPSNLLYPENSGWVPYWYVDVILDGDTTPRGRDLPSSALVSTKGSYPVVNARSSRDGLTFDPSSMGFIPAGALLASRIGRPLLRSLSMRAWVEAMAKTEDLGVRLSSPGRKAELVRTRLGTRRDLLGLVAGGTLPMLQAFVRRQKQPEPAEREPEIVVLGVDPYLSFQAIDALLPGTADDTMNMIDNLVSTRLLRRGLLLDCAECGRPSFVDADRLGQRFECPQCATSNALVSSRWKREATEPRWFYDLYTTFRELLADRGDVVLLAASNLQGNSGTYEDTPELEFYELDSGKAVAEVDVIASVDGDVVLVEAKAGGAFGSKQRGVQTDKLLRVAKVLRADRIQLATTQDHWNETDVAHLTKQAAAASPFAIQVDVATALD